MDDPRNTDQAWVETTAINYHDESAEEVFQQIELKGGEQRTAKWVQVNSNLEVYSYHGNLIKRVSLMESDHSILFFLFWLAIRFSVAFVHFPVLFLKTASCTIALSVHLAIISAPVVLNVPSDFCVSSW